MASKTPPPPIGTCKTVYNPRTKRCSKLCYVGKDESRSGWRFQAGSSHACKR